ncbi:unnamed protein product [Prunus armeniaca]|uniref:Uncharacterized protein n=1 Tax=Prunus armeniaca TaxID=36596 RepID=A0A6J5XF92_PRUAR|nr:unnamed protein product [Prunus armeniaca]
MKLGSRWRQGLREHDRMLVWLREQSGAKVLQPDNWAAGFGAGQPHGPGSLSGVGSLSRIREIRGWRCGRVLWIIF